MNENETSDVTETKYCCRCKAPLAFGKNFSGWMAFVRVGNEKQSAPICNKCLEDDNNCEEKEK